MNQTAACFVPSETESAPAISSDREAAHALREAAMLLDIDFEDRDRGAELLARAVAYLERNEPQKN